MFSLGTDLKIYSGGGGIYILLNIYYFIFECMNKCGFHILEILTGLFIFKANKNSTLYISN